MLVSWAQKMAAQGKLLEYQAANNRVSLDGLPGLHSARRKGGGPRFASQARQLVVRGLRSRDVLVLVLMLMLMLGVVVGAAIGGVSGGRVVQAVLWGKIRASG